MSAKSRAVFDSDFWRKAIDSSYEYTKEKHICICVPFVLSWPYSLIHRDTDLAKTSHRSLSLFQMSIEFPVRNEHAPYVANSNSSVTVDNP